MKKMNLLVMSLVSAAALSFTSCSSNDDWMVTTQVRLRQMVST